MSFRKYIGDKSFYRYVLGIAMPIMIQNLITNFVNLLDNLMVGFLGTEEVASVAIVNQLVFIYNLTLFGAISGAGIFAAQYFGKKDYEGIRHTIRYKTMVCALMTVGFGIVFLFAGEHLINGYLSDGNYNCDLTKALNLAKDYLMVIVIGFVPMAITQIYASTLKESGQTFVPMVAGFVAVCVNTFLNLMLIFGIGFFPKLGVVGAAIGTTVSRFVECAVVYGYICKNKKKHHYFKGAFRSMYIPKRTVKLLLAKGIPLLINECIWSVGMSLLTLAYSKYGLVFVAAQSIASTVLNFFYIIFRALGIAVGIVAGKRLGAREFDEAIDEVRKLNAFSVAVSIGIGIIVFFLADYITLLYNVAHEAKQWASFFIKVSALFTPFLSYENSAYFTLRSGGKILVTFLMDGCFVFFVTVPVAFAFQAFCPVAVTFVAVQSLSILKTIIGAVMIKRKTWVCSIV